MATPIPVRFIGDSFSLKNITEYIAEKTITPTLFIGHITECSKPEVCSAFKIENIEPKLGMPNKMPAIISFFPKEIFLNHQLYNDATNPAKNAAIQRRIII